MLMLPFSKPRAFPICSSHHSKASLIGFRHLCLTSDHLRHTVYQFARPAVTVYLKLNGLNNRHVLSHSSWGWKSKGEGLSSTASF